MFLVGDGWKSREEMIRRFAKEDGCVGVLLAAANFEWVIRRCMRLFGVNYGKRDEERNKPGSLEAYKEMWTKIVVGALPKDRKNYLVGIINDAVSMPPGMKNEAVKKKKIQKTGGVTTPLAEKVIAGNGWGALCYAYSLRHVLIHGVKGSASPRFEDESLEVLLASAKGLVDFSKNHGKDVFQRIPARKQKEAK